jgi:NAD(P)-dependent dehydrogenase (short-subunit alcohol dehydrogenase family)
MELSGKVVAVTGAASGIGRAMARRFHAEGAAAIGIIDHDAAGARALSEELNGIRPGSALAIAGNVTRTEEVSGAIDAIQHRFGPIDLYCANAGVISGADLDTPDADWDLAFGVNVKAHYFAARQLVPEWIERGHGYFLTTASAAGLLSQIGSAPYAVTKHAAVAFAEWLSITYGDRGIKVSCLCPQGVNTNMLTVGANSAGAAAVRAGGRVLEADDVAEAVVEGLRAERFLILPHPEVLTYWQRKTGDYDRWLGGMRKLQARVAD